MKTKKTLSLRRETLATLAKETLADVAGGNANLPTVNAGCLSRAICPPTLPLCIPSVKGSCQLCA